MAYVIAEPCVGTKDKACVPACPVDCIYEGTKMLYIHPEECIDCGACVPACPVAAIYDSAESTPASQKMLIEANAIFRTGEAAAVEKAESFVKAHVQANAALMAIPPAERAAAHSK